MKKRENKKREIDKFNDVNFSFFGIVIRYMKKNVLSTSLILLSVIITSILTAFSPKLTEQLMFAIQKDVYNYLEPSQNKKYWGLSWNTIVWIMIAQTIVIAIFTWLSQYFMGLLGKEIEIDLRRKAMEKLVEQDMSFYSDKKNGEVLTKIISDSQILGDQASIVPATMLNSVFTFVATMIVSFTIDWKLTTVALVTYFVILISLVIGFVSLRKTMYKVRDTITKINGDVLDRISTVKLIKSSGTEDYEEQNFIEKHKEYYNQAEKMMFGQSLMITLLIVGITSVQVVVIVAASLIYGTNDSQFAARIVTFVSSVVIMTSPIMQMIRVIVGMVQATTSSKRIGELLKTKTRINNHFKDHEGIIINEIKGDIIFENLEFEYPEKPGNVVLPEFNFKFEQGKSYAFVGTTGAGKSTISKLLLRFYDPTRGRVLINNNIDLKEVYLSSYLRHVGYVEQEPAIILGNVWDNVKYGSESVTNEQIIEACKKAELHNLIMTWPEGYDTILGERGFMLSGGQKQRLVIARMFLKNPQLLILDEATSALDNVVEKEIQQKLEELTIGRTTITIAHRLSTIKNVDEIIVLAPKQGIVQRGTFEELKKIPGHFKNLYEAGKMNN